MAQIEVLARRKREQKIQKPKIAKVQVGIGRRNEMTLAFLLLFFFSEHVYKIDVNLMRLSIYAP